MNIVSSIYKNENHHALKLLNEEDREIIKRIMSRMSIFKVNSYDAQVIQRELIGMAQEYSLRGESFNDAIGNELKAFADGVVANSNGRSIVEIILRFIATTSLYIGAATMVSSLLLYSTWIWKDIPQLLFLIWFTASSASFLAEHILKPKYCFETGYKKNIPQLVAIAIFVGIIMVVQYLDIAQSTMTLDVRYLAVTSFALYIAASYFNRLNLQRFEK